MQNGYRQTGMGALMALFLAAGLASATGMPADYELARWAFNEGSGTNTADMSGHGWPVTMLKDNGSGNAPTVTNTLWTSDTPSGTGNALALNGTDQYASPEPFGNGNTLWTLSTLTNWSMSLWVKVQANGAERAMLGHWDGWGNAGWAWDHLSYGGPDLAFYGVVDNTHTPLRHGVGGWGLQHGGRLASPGIDMAAGCRHNQYYREVLSGRD